MSVASEIGFRLVDVFSDRPFGGNQLCVVPDARRLAPGQMQGLAGEIGFSETAFVTDIAGDRYRLRIFTPTMELPFAGHPTLGTAYVLAAEGLIPEAAMQRVAAGTFEVRVLTDEHYAEVRQQPPQFGSEATDRVAVAEAVGVSYRDLHPDLPPQVVGTGLPYLLVPVTSATAVSQAVRSDRLLPRLVNAAGVHGCYVFAITGERRAKARMFDADPGILEDAATGSAAGPLGAYLFARGVTGGGRIEVHQGEEIGRPSTLHVTVSAGEEDLEVTVGGGVHVVGRGVFFGLPEG